MINIDEIECAIFDLDGTLLDSTDVWVKIDYDFMGKRGLEVTEKYMEEIKTHNLSTGAEYVVKEYGLNESPDDVLKEWYDAAQHAYDYEVVLKPYAKEYLEKLKSKGIKLAVATSSDRELFEKCLKRNEIYNLFDSITTTSEVERGKKFPDVYIEAARRCSVDIDKCVVFEDILSATKAAKSGGFKVVVVADEASKSDEREIRAICDAFINSYEEIL